MDDDRRVSKRKHRRRRRRTRRERQGFAFRGVVVFLIPFCLLYLGGAQLFAGNGNFLSEGRTELIAYPTYFGFWLFAGWIPSWIAGYLCEKYVGTLGDFGSSWQSGVVIFMIPFCFLYLGGALLFVGDEGLFLDGRTKLVPYPTRFGFWLLTGWMPSALVGYICKEFAGTLGAFGPSWQSGAASHFKLFIWGTVLFFALPVGGILVSRLVADYQLDNGPQRSYYADGELRSMAHRKGGVLHGISEYWDINGEKTRELHYENGKENGVETRWEGPQVILRGEWRNGARVGVWEEWHANGQQKSRGSFEISEDGLADYRVGLWETWDDSGAKLSEGNYEKNAQIGEWREWYPSGQLIRVSHFGPDEVAGVVQPGNRVGLWREWYENGQLRSEGEWGAGAKQGPWKEWHEAGQPRFDGTRVDGRDSVATLWNENGSVYRILDESLNRYGQRVRLSKVYYPNGQLQFIARGLDGELQGLQELWFANGVKQEEGEFHLGKKHGTWSYWNHDGEELGREQWSDGDLISAPVVLHAD